MRTVAKYRLQVKDFSRNLRNPLRCTLPQINSHPSEADLVRTDTELKHASDGQTLMHGDVDGVDSSNLYETQARGAREAKRDYIFPVMHGPSPLSLGHREFSRAAGSVMPPLRPLDRSSPKTPLCEWIHSSLSPWQPRDTRGASPPRTAKGGLTSAPAPDTLQMKSNVFLRAAELLNPARSFQAAAPSLVNAAGVQVVVVAGRQMEGDGDACARTGMVRCMQPAARTTDSEETEQIGDLQHDGLILEHWTSPSLVYYERVALKRLSDGPLT
ncbi:unnamed protein product [Arctogadus glacialis]